MGKAGAIFLFNKHDYVSKRFHNVGEKNAYFDFYSSRLFSGDINYLFTIKSIFLGTVRRAYYT